MRILDAVTLEEYRRLLVARRAYRAGLYDEFVRLDAFERRVCRLGGVHRCGPPNWRMTGDTDVR